MKVVHLAKTPTAGSPIRIVNALNAHTDVQARLVVGNPNHYGKRTFDGDLSWEEDRDEAMAEIESADIIHLHRFMVLEDKPFGLDFENLKRQGKAIIRQFHANPQVMANRRNCPASDIIDDPVPQLVISQFHERFYPRARVVPNIVPLDDERYMPVKKSESPVTVFFAPSVTRTAWESRWETKAYPETRKLLKRFAKKKSGVELDIRTDCPFDVCIRARRSSHVSIDELATGSFHLASLESLAQGIPTLAYLDQRMQWMLRELTGSDDLPWVNVHLDSVEAALGSLAEDAELRDEIGAESREWMTRYWNDRDMVQHYVRAYRDLLEQPDCYNQSRFDLRSKRVMWMVQNRDDAVWESRRARANSRGLVKSMSGSVIESWKY